MTNPTGGCAVTGSAQGFELDYRQSGVQRTSMMRALDSYQPDQSLTCGGPVQARVDLLHRVPRTLNGAAIRAAPAWVGALWRVVVARVVLVVIINDIKVLHRCKSAYRGAGRRCPAYPPDGYGDGVRAKKPGVEDVLHSPACPSIMGSSLGVVYWSTP